MPSFMPHSQTNTQSPSQYFIPLTSSSSSSPPTANSHSSYHHNSSTPDGTISITVSSTSPLYIIIITNTNHADRRRLRTIVRSRIAKTTQIIRLLSRFPSLHDATNIRNPNPNPDPTSSTPPLQRELIRPRIRNLFGNDKTT
ncbi:hypothetical protein AC579_4966 [Pseudocercospora musae]|uniref:Uncharacterized protein n=1 Tax=Pseudocercospora musae TaxID=113226 RepID=A0A139GVP7_9PEZI|nr:hypothetical protein AC579_4966 [Pseudocercospora musae]